MLECELEPAALLVQAQEIENALGRDRPNEVRWGPRTLDVDILMAGSRGEIIMDEPSLRLPHPRMKERGFALAPLVDLDPMLMHPELGRTLRALMNAAHADGQAWAPTGDTL
jgi:2-amino-4-hydroxy-6-hydroxymethyldihydropteridine diphosphokinase